MKNKTTIGRIFSSLLIVTTLVACGGSDSDNTMTVFQPYTAANTYRLVGTADAYGHDTDVVVRDSVSIVLPVMLAGCKAEAVCDTILYRALGHTGSGNIDAVLESWLTDCMEAESSQSGFRAEKTGYDNDADGFSMVYGFVVGMDAEVLTYCIQNSYMQPGAAHGFMSRDYLTYLFKERQILLLSDIFTPEGLEALPARIAERASQDKDLQGEVTIDALPSGGNYYLTPNGQIIFAYQPMEVGPYYLGMVEVPFIPQELSEYMTPEAVRIFGLEDLLN